MITGNLYFNKLGKWEAWRIAVILPEMARRMLPEQGYDKDSPPLLAIVAGGKWSVKCECGGSEYAWEEGWFMCMNCLNAAHGHKYRRVVFSRNRAAIERALLPRPLPNRNWNRPADLKRLGRPETLADLKRENEEHKAEMLEVN